MAGIRNILRNIPVYPAACMGMSALVSCCAIASLVVHYVTKFHLPKFLLVSYFILVFVGVLCLLLSAIDLVKEWRKALATAGEVAPPEQELPRFPGAPQP